MSLERPEVLIPLFDSFQTDFFGKLKEDMAGHSITDYFEEKPNISGSDKYYLVSNGKIVRALVNYATIFDFGDTRHDFANMVLFTGDEVQSLRLFDEMKRAGREFDIDIGKSNVKDNLTRIGVHNLPTHFSDFYFPNKIE